MSFTHKKFDHFPQPHHSANVADHVAFQVFHSGHNQVDSHCGGPSLMLVEASADFFEACLSLQNRCTGLLHLSVTVTYCELEEIHPNTPEL